MITAWVIYDHPQDYPEHWVVRAQDIIAGEVIPRKECTLHATLSSAREAIPAGFCSLPPFSDDDPVIVEVWI